MFYVIEVKHSPNKYGDYIIDLYEFYGEGRKEHAQQMIPHRNNEETAVSFAYRLAADLYEKMDLDYLPPVFLL